MASIFKPKGRKSYVICFYDGTGKRRRVKGCSDLAATKVLAAKLESEAFYRGRGIVTAEADRQTQSRQKPLTEHIEDFKIYMQGNRRTAGHIHDTIQAITTACNKCGFIMLHDLNADSLDRYKADLLKAGSSVRKVNSHIVAVKSFSRWLVRQGRAGKDPLAALQKLGRAAAAADQRHPRRALTVKEAGRLLQVTRTQPTRWGMTGEERATLYRLALETGYRSGELRSLKVCDFDFKNNLVRLDAAHTKDSLSAAIRIKAATMADMKTFLAGKLPQAPAFHMPHKSGVAKMLREDIEAAEIDYQDAAGRFADFHALRHTFGSLMAAAGVHPKICQQRMRHKTIELTMNLYTHTYLSDEIAAVDATTDLWSVGESASANVSAQDA